MITNQTKERRLEIAMFFRFYTIVLLPPALGLLAGITASGLAHDPSIGIRLGIGAFAFTASLFLRLDTIEEAVKAKK